MYSDHDYVEDVQKKRKEYASINSTKRQKVYASKLPVSKMHVHLNTGTVTFHNASQTIEDLRKCMFPLEPSAFTKSKSKGITKSKGNV